MGMIAGEDGVEMQRVLVVAAQKDMVMDYVNAVKKAKLQVDNIDLQAFAMMRSMRPSGFLKQEGSREAIAIANIASDITNIVVDVGGDPQFTRIISFGGDDFTKAVQEHQGLPFDEAELLKIKAGLPEPGAAHTGEEPVVVEEERAPMIEGIDPEDIPFRPQVDEAEGFEGAVPVPGQEMEPGLPVEETGPPQGPVFGPPEKAVEITADDDELAISEEERIKQVQRVLEVTAETLADELRRSFDYYMSQEAAVPISMLLVSGGGALLPNIHSHLSQMFPFEVRMGEPTERIVENKSDLTDEELKVLAPRLAIAIGLSLEDEES
jgi:type IV pilus assembly protein PilM